MLNRITSTTLVALMCLVLMPMQPISAQTSRVVDERIRTMKSIESDMRSISATLRNNRLRYGLIGAAANRIEGHASRMPNLYRQEDTTPPSKSSELIWDQFDRFTQLSRRMERAALQLERSALDQAKGSQILGDFRELGATCGACHRDYRLRD